MCHARQRAELSPEDFRVLSAAWRIERLCAACDRTTEWTFAEAAVEAEEQLDFWDWLATTGELFAPAEARPHNDQRKDRRVDLHIPLLVSSGEVEEEVSSENISESGVAFWSARTYRLGETIRMTLEPPGSAAPQTKTAVIVRASPPSDARILYGARLT
jgi:PilZ domain-containing protein